MEPVMNVNRTPFVQIAAAGQIGLRPFAGKPVLAEGKSRSRTLDSLKKLGDGNAQASRDPLDVDEADVAGASLDVAQVGSVDAGPFREVFLGQAQVFAPALDGKAEALADVRRGPPFFH
jgi:hypothetical protein